MDIFDSFHSSLNQFNAQLTKAIFGHKKYFVTKMEYLPESKYLRMHCLTNSGVFQKDVSIEDFIPVTHDDYRFKSQHSLVGYPTFIDHEMVFYNVFQAEFYLFDTEALWNEQNITHEGLAVENLLKEKLWFDYTKANP